MMGRMSNAQDATTQALLTRWEYEAAKASGAGPAELRMWGQIAAESERQAVVLRRRERRERRETQAELW